MFTKHGKSWSLKNKSKYNISGYRYAWRAKNTRWIDFNWNTMWCGGIVWFLHFWLFRKIHWKLTSWKSWFPHFGILKVNFRSCGWVKLELQTHSEFPADPLFICNDQIFELFTIRSWLGTRLMAGGKPSTWLPPGRLVEQFHHASWDKRQKRRQTNQRRSEIFKFQTISCKIITKWQKVEPP